MYEYCHTQMSRTRESLDIEHMSGKQGMLSDFHIKRKNRELRNWGREGVERDWTM